MKFVRTKSLNVNGTQRENWCMQTPHLELPDSGDCRYSDANTLRLHAISAKPCRIVGVENFVRVSTDHNALGR